MKPAVLLVLPIVCAMAGLATADPPYPSTFSIVAADPETGEVGVAVASRFFAVGSVVPYAKAGVGAVATQAFANTTYGPRGLELLEKGLEPGRGGEGAHATRRRSRPPAVRRRGGQ